MPIDATVYVYILECSDGFYYVGSHRGPDIEVRVGEHNEGLDKKAFTYPRRPVKLMWAEVFPTYSDAVEFERQLKGWSRKKKEAVINGDWDLLPHLSKSQSKPSS